MKNRSKSSCLFPLVVSMAHPPVEARLPGLLALSRRARPTLLSAFMGTAVVAATLASVQARAGQTPVAGGNRSSVVKPAVTSQKSRNAKDIAMLRKKLETLEQILVQNQQENARLRQQVRALEAQQHRKVALTNKAATASPVSVEQIAASETILRDLQTQQALLKTRALQADALYRNGSTTYHDAIRAKADESLNRVRIEAAQAQIRALKAGHQPSQKEQILAELREHLAEYKAELVQEQEGLKIARARAQAGLITNAELADEEGKVNLTQVEIDKLNSRILQESAR